MNKINTYNNIKSSFYPLGIKSEQPSWGKIVTNHLGGNDIINLG